jgi:hypothetical protein
MKIKYIFAVIFLMGISYFILNGEKPHNISTIKNNKSNHSWNTTLLGSIPTGYCDAVYITGDTVFYSAGNYIVIADISNPADPIKLGTMSTEADIGDIKVKDNYAYVVNDSGLNIIDISDYTNIVNTGFFRLPYNKWFSNYYEIAINNNYAYVSNYWGLYIIDITDPTNLKEMSYLNHYIKDIYIMGNYAYLACGDEGLIIIDITDPVNPHKISKPSLEHAENIYIKDNYAYIDSWGRGGNSGGIYIIDITDPINPIEINFLEQEYFTDIAINGDYAYITTCEELKVFDISDPVNPKEKGFANFTLSPFLNPGGCDIKNVVTNQKYAFVTTEIGLSIVDISNPSNPVETDFITTLHGYEKVKVRDNYAYVIEHQTLRVIDISNFFNPFITEYQIELGFHNDIDIYEDCLYLVQVPGGLRIFDISESENLVETNSYYIYGNGPIIVDSIYVYIADSGRVSIIEVTDLNIPQKISDFVTGYHQEDIDISDSYIFLAEGNKGLCIIDISDPYNPVQINRYSTNHAKCITVNNNYAYLGDWGKGIIILDISNPSSPIKINNIDIKHAHEIVIIDNYAYIAADDRGLQIYDISDPFNPFKVGYYYPHPGYAHHVEGVAVQDGIIYLAAGGLYIIRNDLAVKIDNKKLEQPADFALSQNYPNPFNPITTIGYEIPQSSHVVISVYDLQGSLVETLVNRNMEAGYHSVKWDASNVSSGIYLYQIQACSYVKTQKMVVIK